MSKAATAEKAVELTDIPHIDQSIAADLRGIGIATPDDVRRMDPQRAYDALRDPIGYRHAPCVLDVFLAAPDFMIGGAPKSWWDFTARRRALLASLKN